MPPTITRSAIVPATAVSVLPATSSGAAGTTVNLTATLTPTNSSDEVNWTTSDPAIATVEQTGRKTARVTRVAAGSATITATARTFTATSTITVV
ncbi:Ig-like domain-containing protein [Serratia fonticola]